MNSGIKKSTGIKDGSECIALFKSIDWSQHPLGATVYWPQSLLSTLSIIFYSKFPMFVFWGPDLYCFYNDAYRPSFGNNGKHPAAMGEKGHIVWPEIWDVIHPEIQEVMNGGDATWHVDLYLPIFRNNRMEDVYWTYSYSPVLGEAGTVAGVLVTCNETTEQVFAKELLINLTNKLKINEAALLKSNESLEQYAYLASHDLKEPLRTVTSFIELLKNKYAGQLDKKAHSYIDFALDGGKRMQKMVSDLLELSRSGEKEDIKEMKDLNEILSEVESNISILIGENHAGINVITPLPVLPVYTSQINRLLQNLLTNAIKFRQKEIDPIIYINAVEQEDVWLFSIRDNGIGMDQQDTGKLFEIFTRLHSWHVYEGSGIGLAACKKIAELHGGSIWVESEAGKGSTFYFTLLKIK